LAKSKFNFFELNIEGLDNFFNYLLSYSKSFQSKAKRILNGVNTKNINRKIRKIVKTTMKNSSEFEIKMGKKFNTFVVGSYSIRNISKSDTETLFKLHNKFDDSGADKQIVKTHGSNSWRFSTKSMFSVMNRGRRSYTIPSDGSKRKMVWICQKGAFVGKVIRKTGPLQIPAFGGFNFISQIEDNIKHWFSTIQDKFLNLK